MIGVQTFPAAPDRADAWRLALAWLGMLVILVAVTCVALPALGMACIALGSVAILVPAVTSRATSGPSAFLHGLCAVLAALAAFGLCASRCGSYAQYAEFLGLPTAVAACLLHGAAAILLVVGQHSERLKTVATAVVATAIGASLLFASIQLRLGIWCSACAAIHVLMAVQAVALIRSESGSRRAAVIIGMLAAAGLMNAVYHHGPQPAAPDDARELLSYLRSAWTAPDPPQRIQVRAVDTDAVRREGVAIAHRLAAAAAAVNASAPMDPRAGQPAQSTPVRTTPQPRPTQATTLRSIADANRWGSAQAPVTLLVKLDTGCPVCARQFAQLRELEDLVIGACAAGALPHRLPQRRRAGIRLPGLRGRHGFRPGHAGRAGCRRSATNPTSWCLPMRWRRCRAGFASGARPGAPAASSR